MSSFVLAHKNNNKVAYSKSSSTFTKASKPPPRNRTDNSYDMLVSSSSNRVFHLQKSIGNQAIQKLLNGNPLHDLGNKIQTKLKVNNPGDVYEHEADKIADQVMKMSSSSESKPNLISSTIHNERSDSEKCSECKIKEQEPEVKNISRKPFTNSSDLEVTDKITNEIGDIRANSSLILDSSTKEFMESRFGNDFSTVKIHTGDLEDKSTNAINAIAYTVVNDITFGKGQYQPHTVEGRKLLAHELTHVVQQSMSAGASAGLITANSNERISRQKSTKSTSGEELEKQFRQAILRSERARAGLSAGIKHPQWLLVNISESTVSRYSRFVMQKS